jgi:hypothetical protein
MTQGLGLAGERLTGVGGYGLGGEDRRPEGAAAGGVGDG